MSNKKPVIVDHQGIHFSRAIVNEMIDSNSSAIILSADMIGSGMDNGYLIFIIEPDIDENTSYQVVAERILGETIDTEVGEYIEIGPDDLSVDLDNGDTIYLLPIKVFASRDALEWEAVKMAVLDILKHGPENVPMLPLE